MSDVALLGTWIRRFLLDHLVTECNLARNTQRSYRDTLSLLLPFIAQQIRKEVDQISVTDVSAEVVRHFLQHLEDARKCGIATRNQRPAAIHSLARFIDLRSPEHVAWSGQVRSFPPKRAPRSAITYLEKSEMDALLNAPDQTTRDVETTHCCSFFTTLVLAPMRPHRPKSLTSQ